MTLAELITALEAANPDQIVEHGFTHPHSYRGNYYELAFEPASNVTVGAMLADARSALDTTYEGWKGGDFTMREHTWCWLSTEGDASGDTISALLLKLMLTETSEPVEASPASLISPDQWSTIRSLVDWLDHTNGRDQEEITLRILKLTEEVGEVAQAWIGATGQNPRKGVTHTRQDVAGELVDVIVTAAVALASIVDEPGAVLDTKLAKIAARSLGQPAV